MTLVRVFRSRLVHQDRAAEVVLPAVDSLVTNVPTGTARSVDLDAYDDETDTMYVYRQQRGDDVHVGIVCDVHPEAFHNGSVLGHESVRDDRVEGLIRYFATTPARPELVALVHEAGPVFTRAVEDAFRSPPALRFLGPDGLEQTVWRVPTGATTAALAEELGGTVQYIADGHHRVAASLALWRSAGGPGDAGVPCVVYPRDGLRLGAFDRMVTGPVDRDRLMDLVRAAFDVRGSAGPPESTLSGMGVYAAGQWSHATFDGVRRDGAAGLDATLLHDLVLEPLVAEQPGVGIEPVRAPLADLVRTCDRHDGALFTLRPPDLDTVAHIADRGEVMPPKTTFFEPKPCTGIFLRA